MTITKEAETKEGYCQCGRLLHYRNPQVGAAVQELADLAKDPFVTITISGHGSYRVQRHFIALHGISHDKLEEYGFEKIPTPERTIHVGS